MGVLGSVGGKGVNSGIGASLDGVGAGVDVGVGEGVGVGVSVGVGVGVSVGVCVAVGVGVIVGVGVGVGVVVGVGVDAGMGVDVGTAVGVGVGVSVGVGEGTMTCTVGWGLEHAPATATAAMSDAANQSKGFVRHRRIGIRQAIVSYTARAAA